MLLLAYLASWRTWAWSRSCCRRSGTSRAAGWRSSRGAARRGARSSGGSAAVRGRRSRRRGPRSPRCSGDPRRPSSWSRSPRARLRAGAGAHGAAEQLRLAHLPPRARRGVGAARRLLLGRRTLRPTGSTSSSRSPSSRSSSCSRPRDRRRSTRCRSTSPSWRSSSPSTGRRGALGFGVRPSACASFLLATFTLSRSRRRPRRTTSWPRSFPIVAACLLLGESGVEAVLAGVAVGVRARGEADDGARAADPRCCSRCCGGGARRVLALGGALVAFAAVGMWGYVLNHDHTGKLLGHGQGRIENTTSPSWPGTGVTALFLVYETMDRGGAHEPGGALARGDRHRRGDRRRRLGADAPPPGRGGVGGGGRRAAVRVGAARDRRRLGALLALGSLGTSDSPAEGDRRAAQLTARTRTPRPSARSARS